MIGAFKGCGSRVIRGVTSPTAVLTLEPPSIHYGLGSSCCTSLNWSQKRFLRGQPPSSKNGEGSDSYIVKPEEEIIQCKSEEMEKPFIQQDDSKNTNLSNYKPKFCRSVSPNENELLKLIAEISKLIVEDDSVTVRVKTRKHEDLLVEWIGIQKEIRTVKLDRVEDDRKKLQIAGQQARLTKGINLDDLDQAIEGSFCSQAKNDYGQQKWRDN